MGVTSFPQTVAGIPKASDTLGTVDSHFHLDKLLQRSGKSSLHQVEEASAVDTPIAKFVAVYCFPRSWPTPKQHSYQASDSRIAFTYGIHPRQASQASPADIAALPSLLQRTRVVALGEVGLDYAKNPQKDAVERCRQQDLLEQLLPHAATQRLPLVIHCRDRGCGLATPDCCRLVRKHLTRDHPIHVHCFSSGLKELKIWQEHFSNVHFGFTATLLYPERHPELDTVVQQLAQCSILLETDSPYLPPPGTRCKAIGTPWMIGAVASRIASLRGISLSSVLRTAAVNAARLYHL